MRASSLLRPRPVTLSLELEDESLTLTFDANKITPNWMRWASEHDDDPMVLPKALAGVLVAWDVTEEDGSGFEPSEQNLAQLPFPLQSLLLTEILQAAMPASEEGNASTNTSATPNEVSMSEPESHQNGQQPSQLPSPSVSAPST